MRLIDADVLLNNTDGLEHVKYSQEYGHVVLVCDIVYAPTVDATEVVRCKDCKWFDMSDIAGTIEPICYRCKRFARTYRNADDFCSYGERKETENAKIH